jgi:hypothetical protein
MRELISGTLRKAKLTEETIKHIKYWWMIDDFLSLTTWISVLLQKLVV